MKKKHSTTGVIIAVICFMAMAVATSDPDYDSTHYFRLTLFNAATVNITEVLYKSSQDESWQESKNFSRSVLSEESRYISISHYFASDISSWDLRVIDEIGNERDFFGYDLREIETLIFTEDENGEFVLLYRTTKEEENNNHFTLQNDSTVDITGVFIKNPMTETGYLSNLRLNTVISPDDSVRKKIITEYVKSWDLLIIDENENRWEFFGYDLRAIETLIFTENENGEFAVIIHEYVYPEEEGRITYALKNDSNIDITIVNIKSSQHESWRFNNFIGSVPIPPTTERVMSLWFQSEKTLSWDFRIIDKNGNEWIFLEYDLREIETLIFTQDENGEFVLI
jgi:hypothetical protein